jgi:excisionase family DNA binding protein
VKRESSQLINDTHVVKKVLEKYFDREFDYVFDSTATTAVLIMREEDAGKELMNVRELAAYLQVDAATIRGLTKERAQRRADPLPFHKSHGKMIRFKRTEVDAWLKRNARPNGNQLTISQVLDKASNCPHEPKHLKGLCLKCYNDDFRQENSETDKRTEEAWATSKDIPVLDGSIQTVSHGGKVYYRAHRELSESLSHNNQVAFVSEALARALDQLFDRSWDILVSVENGETGFAVRHQDREKNWMTVEDVALRLCELYSRGISRAAVRRLTKERAQKGKNPLPFYKGHSKMILFWRPEFEAWFKRREEMGARELKQQKKLTPRRDRQQARSEHGR